MANKYDVILAVLTLILTLIGIARPFILKALTGRKREAAELLSDYAEIAVNRLQQVVGDLKSKDKPGEWNPEVAAEIKRRAVQIVRKLGAAELQLVTGAATGSATIDEFLDNLIEAHVNHVKNNQAPSNLVVVETDPGVRDAADDEDGETSGEN